jgi:DNA-binding NarL/FixJ family response regulator
MGVRGEAGTTPRVPAAAGTPRFLLVEDSGSTVGARLEAIGWRPDARASALSAVAAAAIGRTDVVVVVCTERALLTPAFQAEAERLGRWTRRVAVIAGGSPDAAAYAARLGWHGFVAAESGEADIVATMIAVARGELSFPAGTTSALVRALARTAPVMSAAVSALTPRQQQIVALIAQGATDAEISSVLGISRSTAHKHVQNARRRMRAKTRSQLVAAALPDPLAWQPT